MITLHPDPTAAELAAIYAVYGLAFLLLAMAIALAPRDKASRRLLPSAGLVGTFALLHGTYELLEGWQVLRPAGQGVHLLSGALLLGSYAALLEFGRRVGGPHDRPLPRWIYLPAAAGVALLWAAWDNPSAGLRYFIGFPAALLAGLGLLRRARAEADPLLQRYMTGAGVAFLLYGALAGLVVKAHPALPAMLPTRDDFLALTGLPVQLLRAACGAALALCFALAFRRASARLRDSEQRSLRELRALSEQLEQRVAERTAELGAANEALHRNELRLRAILDAEPEFVTLLDREGRILDINRSGLTMMEADSPGQLLGREFGSLLGEAHRAAFGALREQVFQGEPGSIECEVHGMRGTRRWVDGRATPLHDAEGKVTAMVAVARDVSERRAAEQALRESEALLAEAQRTAHLGNWQLDIDSGRASWSDEEFRLLGHEPGAVEATADSFLAAVHPDDRQAVLSEMRRAMASPAAAPMHIEHRVLAPAGVRVVEQRARVSFDRDGRAVRMFGTTLDVTGRRLAERALQESEASLRRAQSVGRIGSWHLDLAANRLQWSAETYRIFGVAEGAPLAYEIFTECAHPDDRAFVDGAWRAALAGAPYDIEHRIVVDGQVKWVRQRAELEFDERGRVLSGTGVVQDITERRRAEMALRERDQAFRTLVENVPGAVYRCAVQSPWRMLYLSEGIAQICGRPAQAFVSEGLSYAEIILPEDLPKVERVVADGVAQQRAFELEYRIRHADGSVRWVHEKGRAIDDAQDLRLDGVIIDITERKLAEHALRESETLFRDLAQLSPVGIFRTDAQGECVYVNARWCEIAGLSESQAMHRGWLAAIHPDDRPRLFQRWQDELARGGPFSAEYRFRRPDGSVTWVIGRAVPQTGPDGAPGGYIGCVTDVTGLKHAEELLRASEARLRLFHDLPFIGMAITSPASKHWLDVNQTLCDILGYPRDELVQLTWAEITHPEDLDADVAQFDRVMRGASDGYKMDKRFIRKDGQIVHATIDVKAVRRPNGDVDFFVATVADITERKLAEAALAESAQRYRTLVEHAPEAIVVLDTDSGRFIDCNGKAEQLFGLPRAALLTSNPADLSPPSQPDGRPSPEAALEQVRSALAGATPVFEWVHRNASGQDIACEVSLVRMPGSRHLVRGSIIDISARKQAERALERTVEELQAAERRQRELLSLALREQGRMSALLSAMSIGILFEDREGRVEYLNPSFRRMWGIADTVDMVGQPTRDALQHSAHRFARPDHASRYVLQVPDTHEISERFEIDLTDGRVLTQMSYPVDDAEGRHLGRLWIYEDITHERQTAQQLIYLAERDALTGLYNRHRFQEQLDQMIKAAHRSGGKFALVYFDLDEFKHVNDTFGHRAGDTVLVRTAGEISTLVRSSEMFARLGGDEFAILSTVKSARDVPALASRICNAVSSVPFRFRGTNIRITSSVGVALFPKHGQTAEDLVTRADEAMYQAKSRGKNTWAVYDPGFGLPEASNKRLTWTRRIGEALQKELLELHFQGVYRTGSGTLSHLEALVRLRDAAAPDRLIMPGQFIPFAEKSGQILDIDRWVLRRTITMLGQDAGLPPLAVNISGRSFDDPSLPQYIRELLGEHRVEPARLIIELTETSAVSDMQDAQRFIEAIKQAGCRVCLDDFGSGFSSFAYLKYIEVDILKIDGLFIRDLPNNSENQVFVRAMVDVAQGLRMTTVAEFVEDAATLERVRELGVDLAQGFHLDRPGADHPALRDRGPPADR